MARRQQSASRPELPSTPDSRKIDLTSSSRDRRSVMIQSKWCTVTATVCGVLAVASPAAAECAWVLWSRVHDPRPGQWQLQTAYPNVGACARALDQREKEGRKAVYHGPGRHSNPPPAHSKASTRPDSATVNAGKPRRTGSPGNHGLDRAWKPHVHPGSGAS
jgi:hypothetical protein